MPSLTLTALLCVLTHQLGSDSFRQREQAHAALVWLMPLSAPHVDAGRFWHLSRGNTEGAVRCQQIKDRYLQSSARPKALLLYLEWHGQLPWVDQTPDWFHYWPCHRRFPSKDYYESIGVTTSGYTHYLGMARWSADGAIYDSGGHPDYHDWREATFYLLEDLFLDGWTVGQVRSLLEEMDGVEYDWTLSRKR